ncbi:hypothetical protein MY9_3831 [Bacillus sp. JS]|nr:hypothetical protein MY9_3831 [Bacillus sp. JS]
MFSFVTPHIRGDFFKKPLLPSAICTSKQIHLPYSVISA